MEITPGVLSAELGLTLRNDSISKTWGSRDFQMSEKGSRGESKDNLEMKEKRQLYFRTSLKSTIHTPLSTETRLIPCNLELPVAYQIREHGFNQARKSG